MNYVKKFWSMVKVLGKDECWLWMGRLDEKGYGSLSADGFNFRAHRFGWEMVNGPIPEGMWVLHKCDVRRCCNPNHHYLGDHQDNMNDMKERGRCGGTGKKASTPIPWTKANKKARDARRRLREV